MCALWSYVRVVIVICASSCAASDVEETKHRKCMRYRDQLVGLRLSDLPAAHPDSVAAAHREAMTTALGNDFIASCVQNVGNAALECALAARDVSAAARCIEPR